MRGEHVIGQFRALPPRIVGVLDRQLREGGRSPLQSSEVDLGQFAAEDAHRPAVTDEVVAGDQQNVMLRREPQQTEPQHGPGRQVECEVEILLG